MIITRKSILTGIERTRDMNVNPDELHRFMQDDPIALFNFPPEDRIWLRHGTTLQEWTKYMEDQPVVQAHMDEDERG